MKKVYLALLVLIFTIHFSSATLAAQTDKGVETVKEFISEINSSDDNEGYESWNDVDIAYGYELFGIDTYTSAGDLYYIRKHDNNEGYVIVDAYGANVMEFSSGLPAYDIAAEILNIEINSSAKHLYINAMPAIINDDTYVDLNLLGEVKDSVGLEPDVVPFYNPNPQSGNCIVGAISNLLWFWGDNGYGDLYSNMSFKDVESKVDSLINAEGGYTNSNIPNTIKNYVKSKNNKYSASVTNKRNPSFSNVKTETNSRLCLLGFAAGSPYSKSVGHMTVCVGTRSIKSSKYCKLMDGWSSQVVEKL